MLLRILINFYELIMELLFKFFCECVFWVCMNFIYIFFMVIVIVENLLVVKLNWKKNNY